MKKILSLLLAMIMVFSLATVAFADETAAESYTDMQTITFVKNYKNPNNGVSPAETFNFTFESVDVTDGGVINEATGAVVTKDTMPGLVSVSSAAFNEGDAGKVEITGTGVDYKCQRTVTVTLPEYTAVGIYEYKIKETAGTTAGVTYHSDEIKLVVTVIEQDGKIRVAAVHTEGANEQKDDMIHNIYESGTLAVSKEVTGNLGDQDKEFTVKVTFTAPAGETVGAPITYVEEDADKSIAGGWTGSKEVEINLKHEETITFKNIPEGVTYTVVENNYTGEGYKAAKYDFSDEAKVVNGDVDGNNDDTVKITNHKETEVDTGIALDSAPYFVILAVAMFGMVALVAKKRYEV